MKLWKYGGLFLILSGAGHIILGLFVGFEKLISLANRKTITIPSVANYPESTAFFWYCITGVSVIILGHLAHYFIRRTKAPLPPFTGWYLILVGIGLGLFMPFSAVWLFLPQGLIILIAKRP